MRAAMSRRYLRKLAMSVVALLLFAHASFVLSACQRERGSLAQMIAAPAAEEGCVHCGTVVANNDALYANRCFAHCTADLQVAGEPVVLAQSAADTPVLLLPPEVLQPPDTGLDGAPPGAPPRRILLHSFLI